MKYVVNYVTINGISEVRVFATKNEAINFYKTNLHNMAYGYISDEEALDVAEEVKEAYEEELEKRMSELLMNF